MPLPSWLSLFMRTVISVNVVRAGAPKKLKGYFIYSCVVILVSCLKHYFNIKISCKYMQIIIHREHG